MTVHAPLPMSKEAFLDWIDQREERYEYARGRVIMMVHVSLYHALVVTNLVRVLTTRLATERFNVVAADLAVNVGDSVRFPDVLVQAAQADLRAREAKAPILIVEVLWPSTLHVDFGDKRQEYLSLPTLDTYLVVAPDEARVWVWQRTGGAFPSEPEIIEARDRPIALPALGVQIGMDEIYRGIL
jgi:Uma2 family endonuclease